MKMKRSSLLNSPETSGSPIKKRRRLSISEDESLASCSKSSDSPPLSKIYNSTCRNNKPAELFRKDLISAMKLPDNEQLDESDFWYVTDSWKQEWERGVQVPVNSKNVPFPKIKEVKRRVHRSTFKMPKKIIRMAQDECFSSDVHVLSTASQESDKMCRYDLDDLDLNWLDVMNQNRSDWGLSMITEDMFELIMEDLEVQCFNKFQEALKTEEGLGIEYDDDVICDVCRNPECEEGNEMVFCDICNICVHQACYGITAIPEGSWVCRTCAANVQPSCVLCPNKGGAMKFTRTGNKWAHVSCALWVPEVQIVDPEKMEPISRISDIPPSRWALICTFCRERLGACIQCCVKQCKVAYHVTCAFENGLEMNAVYDESNEDVGVKLRSFCSKHAHQNREGEPEGMVWRMKSSKKENKASKVTDLEKHNARLQKIREMEAEFYKYVNLKQVKIPHADKEAVDFVFMYWKLKRTANYNKPLLCTKLDESALLGKQPEDSLYARMKMFVHLRQDLERVRNLCYMVSRREKLRRSYIKSQKEIFLRQIDVLDEILKKKDSKEYESVLASSFGETIYDKIYFGAAYKPPDIPTVKVKEADSDKKKLVSASRLPNPYAKLYFSGIHTRSRGHSSTSANKSGDNGEKSIEDEKSDEVIPIVAPTERARRSSVPTIAVVKVEPKLRERRTSAQFSERNRNEEIGEKETPLNHRVIVKKEKEDLIEIDEMNLSQGKERKDVENRKRDKDNSGEIRKKENVETKKRDNTGEVKKDRHDVEVKRRDRHHTNKGKMKESDDEVDRNDKDNEAEMEKDKKVGIKKKDVESTGDVKRKKQNESEVKKRDKENTGEIKKNTDGNELKKKDRDENITNSNDKDEKEMKKNNKDEKEVRKSKKDEKEVRKNNKDEKEVRKNNKDHEYEKEGEDEIEVKDKATDGNEIKNKDKDNAVVEKNKDRDNAVENKNKDKDSAVEDNDVPVGKKKREKSNVEAQKTEKDNLLETKEKDLEKSELQRQNCDKENVPSIHEDVPKTETVIDGNPLLDVKNSPSQSDKENISARPKMRGRRPKCQVDVKALEMSRTAKENLVISPEKLNNLSHVSANEALKTSNARTSRYEMRSRNNSTSLSQNEEPIQVIDKPVLAKEQITPKDKPPSDIPSSVENSESKVKEFTQQKKVRLKSLKKKRTRRCLFNNSSSKDKCSESLRALSSSDSSSDDSSEEQELSEPTEYKMTLRQNGKVVLSPLRKNDSQGGVLPRDRGTDNSSRDSPSQRTCSFPDDINFESGDSQHASSSSRDTTSSPRIILKLVKDRERQQWQKQSLSTDQEPSTFKVIRNDWESPSNSKNFNEFELLSEFTSGHRYMMRSRSKPNS